MQGLEKTAAKHWDDASFKGYKTVCVHPGYKLSNQPRCTPAIILPGRRALSVCPSFPFSSVWCPSFLSIFTQSLSLTLCHCQLGSPRRSFLFSLSHIVLALLSHLCLVTLLPLSLCILSHTDSPLIFSSNTVIIQSSLHLLLLLSFHPVFLQHSLHLCVKQQQIVDVYFRYNQRQTVCSRGHLPLDAYVLHTCVCVDLCPVQSWIWSFYALQKRERALHVLISYQPWHWLAGFSTASMKILWIHSCFKNSG